MEASYMEVSWLWGTEERKHANQTFVLLYPDTYQCV